MNPNHLNLVVFHITQITLLLCIIESKCLFPQLIFAKCLHRNHCREHFLEFYFIKRFC